MLAMREPSVHRETPPLEIYLLGEVELDDALLLQRRLVYDLGERGGGALILCEHPPTITIGRSGSRFQIAADDAELRELGIRVQWVNRGGGCVLHLPGQLVAYFALPLASFGLDLRRYVTELHRVVLDVLADFDLRGGLKPDTPGVFLDSCRVASIGLAVQRWIAYYGLTLNVGPFLEPYDLIDEPGPNGTRLRQTSMEARRQRPAQMPKVRESLIRWLETTFGLEQHHLYTDHPLVRRKTRSDVQLAGHR